MNNPVTLFVISFVLCQVQSARIPINVRQDGGEGLQDLSARPKRMDEAARNLLIAGEKIEELVIGHPTTFHRLNELRQPNPSRKTKRCPRYYLAENPNLQNTIVGATLRKNFRKLCDQCRQSPMCRGRSECEHCIRYCEPHGLESKGNVEDSSVEEVGIAREPENDFMDHEGKRDMTLVSRSSVGKGMLDSDGNRGKNMEGGEGSGRLQMMHEAVGEESEEEDVVGSQQGAMNGKEEMSIQNNQPGRYYAVGVIKPGLLMNIMLKLINIKQTPDMEKAIILLKSRKGVPMTVGTGDKVDMNFLKMLGRELETAEKIHGKSPLEAEDINKILETAYEKAEFKSKSEAQIASETVKMTPHTDEEKIVSSTNEMAANTHMSRQNTDFNESPAAILHEMIDENPKQMSEEFSDNLSLSTAQNSRSNNPEAMSLVGSANTETSKDSDMKIQHENDDAKLEQMQGGNMGIDSDSDESVEENDKARTLHHKKYKKLHKKLNKKGHHYHQSYGSSYGNYQQPSYGYRRTNEQEPLQMDTQETLTGAQQESLMPLNEDIQIAKVKGSSLNQQTQPQAMDEGLIGSQQGSVRPLNEDLIGYKDQFQQDQKGLTYKGQGEGPKDTPTSQKARDGEDLIGSQQGIVRPFNEDLQDNKGRGDWSQNSPKTQKSRDGEDLIGSQQESLKPLSDYHRDQKESNYKEPIEVSIHKDTSYRSNEGIAQIHLTEKNKKLDPKKIYTAEPIQDTHDGMPGPFHGRLHAHFNKVKEYYENKKMESEKSEPIVSMTESKTLQDSDDIQIEPRTKAQSSDEKDHLETGNNRMADSRETEEGPMNDMHTVGINLQPEDIINLQMANDNGEKEESTDDMHKVGMNIEPQDLIILQKKENGGDMNSEMIQNSRSIQLQAKAADNIEGEFEPNPPKAVPSNDVVVSEEDLNDLDNSIHKPQFSGVKNLPGQTVIQVDDQLIDVPDEGASIFQVNSQPLTENNEEHENFMMEQPEMTISENVGAMNNLPTEDLNISQKDQDSQTLGLSVKRKDASVTNKTPLAPSFAFKKEEEFRSPQIVNANIGNNVRSSERQVITDEETDFPTRNISPIKKNSFAPAFGGSLSPKLIQTEEQGSERSATGKVEEIVGDGRVEYENAIEKKIEKLMTPREQEFLHNFGKIVPSIENMHLNSKSDIYFMGNGIKLPLKMSPDKDGSISLSVDLEKLCKCRNSTCAHKIDMMNKIDENLMEMSNDLNNPEIPLTEKTKVDNNIPLVENITERKVRKPRNHMDLSKLYKTYRKKHHRLHRRSVSNEYFRRFNEIEQGLEKKLNQLNENVKDTNREYDNMLRKGTKDLLQIKEEDQVVKQRIGLVNDLIKWMKEMASAITNVERKST